MRKLKLNLKMLFLMMAVLIALTSCASMGAFFSGAKLSCDNAYSRMKKSDAIGAFDSIAKSLEQTSDYERAHEFMINNFDKMIAKAEADAAAMPEEDYDQLIAKYETYGKFNKNFKALPTKYSHKEAGSKIIEKKNYDAERDTLKETIKVVVFTSAEKNIADGDYKVARDSLYITIQDFFPKEDKEAANNRAAEMFFTHVMTYTSATDLAELDKGYDVLKWVKDFLKTDELKARQAEVIAALNRTKADMYLATIKKLKKSGDEESLLKALDYYDVIIKLLPDESEAYNAQKNGLSKYVATLYYKQAVSFKKKKDNESLLKAWDLYGKTIQYMPEIDQPRYINEKDALYITISDSYFYKLTKAEKNFKKTAGTYNAVLKSYETLESWNPGYKDNQARLEDWKSKNIFRIYVASTLSPADKVCTSLISSLQSSLKNAPFFNVEDYNSNDYSTVASTTQYNFDRSSYGELKSQGFRYLVLFDVNPSKDFSDPNRKRTTTKKESKGDFARIRGKIVGGSDAMTIVKIDGSTTEGTVTDARTIDKIYKVASKIGTKDSKKVAKEQRAEFHALNKIEDFMFGEPIASTFSELWMEGVVSAKVIVVDTFTGKKLLSKTYYGKRETEHLHFLSSVKTSDIEISRYVNSKNTFGEKGAEHYPDTSNWDQENITAVTAVTKDKLLLTDVIKAMGK